MSERIYSQNPKSVQQRARRARRKAAIASGEISFEDIPHGTNGYHNYECRCDVCKTAATKERTANLRKRQERAREDPGIIPHGTQVGYDLYGCRCERCRAVEAERKQRYIAGRTLRSLSPEDVRVVEALKDADTFRAVIKDLKREGRFLIIERVRPGQPGRRLVRVRLEDGPRKRGTWTEVTVRLGQYGLTATGWEPSEGGDLHAKCEVIPVP